MEFDPGGTKGMKEGWTSPNSIVLSDANGKLYEAEVEGGELDHEYLMIRKPGAKEFVRQYVDPILLKSRPEETRKAA